MLTPCSCLSQPKRVPNPGAPVDRRPALAGAQNGTLFGRTFRGGTIHRWTERATVGHARSTVIRPAAARVLRRRVAHHDMGGADTGSDGARGPPGWRRP